MRSRSEDDLALLRRINTIRISGRPLSDFFSYRGASVWSFWQGSLWSSIRRRTGAISPHEVAQTRAPISFLGALFMLGASAGAFFWTMVRRPRVVIYSPDVALGSQRVDSRIALVYDWLNDRSIRYVELVHAIPGRRMLGTWLHRRRPVIYLEALDIIYGILVRFGFWRRRFPVTDWKSLVPQDLDSADRQFIFFMLKRHAVQAEIAAFRIDALHALFRMIRPVHLLTLDDPRNYHELLMAARFVGARSHSFQHGRFDKYFAGHIYYDIDPKLCILPDVFWVWNHYNREKLLRLSAAYAAHSNRVRIGGRPFAKTISALKTKAGQKMTVLMLSEAYAPPRQIGEYIKLILACGDVDIIFSVRSDQPVDRQMERFGLSQFADHPRFTAVTQITPADWERVNLILGTTSTFLEEMVEAGKAVGVLDTDTTQATDLVEDGLADWVSLDTIGRISEIAQLERAILERRRQRVLTTAHIDATLTSIFSA